jgi:large subunit ribosomal protein L25
MAEITLRAETGRIPGSRNAERLRREGKVPAIVYGREMEPVAVAVDHHDLVAALSTEAGRNVLINLDLGGSSVLTLARVVERNPVRNRVRHVDFLKVSLTETIETEVPIHFTGEAAGVAVGGVFSAVMHSVSIEALPTDLPDSIDVDVSGLAIGDHITVADLPAIAGVVYLDDPESMVAHVTTVREEVAPVEAAEEGGEGAEAAAGAAEEASE